MKRFLRLLRVVTIAGGLWGAFVYATGGVETTLLGVRLRSHNYTKPWQAAALALVVLLALDRRPIWWVIARGRKAARLVPSPRTAAWILAAATAVVAYVYGAKVVGGADSYGYVSQADLWWNGSLEIDQPFVAEVPWRMAPWTFAPLGYLPLARLAATTVIVPGYSPGLPMLMAAARAVGGYQAIFVVVPILSGVFVIATFFVGRRLASPAAGLIAAWLVATSPAVTFIMLSPMTDVPVAAMWTIVFLLVLRRTPVSALGAGLASSVALLIRPNLAPIAAVVALPYLVWSRDKTARRQAIVSLLLFGAGVLPGAVTAAVINDRLYGSWLASGYGSFSELFAWSRVPENLRLYLSWLVETHTPLVFIGFAALAVPVRWLWTGPEPRSSVLTGTLVVIVVWLVYCAWGVLDAWWYLRFLLTSWPFIMTGIGAVLWAATRWRPALTKPAAAAVVIGLGLYEEQLSASRGVFRLYEGERRYLTSAALAREFTEPTSVIISHQYSGSLRYYAGRMTLNYGFLDGDALDRAVEFLNTHGAHVYVLIEPSEFDVVRRRFAGQARIAALDRPPLAVHRDPGTVMLFDLSSNSSSAAEIAIRTGAPGGQLAPEPAAPVAFTLIPSAKPEPRPGNP